MRKSIRLTLSGSIQGMFFRQFIKDNADKNGVKGFVRNLEDGKVEVFIEGLVENVNSMAEICRKGPPHAQIRNVEEKDERFQDFKEFKIIRF